MKRIKKGYNTAEFGKIYSQYKSNAKRRGIPFNISKLRFYYKTQQNCYICQKEADGFNGVDRVNNELPYTISNTAGCCWTCNRAKSNMSREEFEDWAKRLGFDLNYLYYRSMKKSQICKEYNTENFSEALLKQFENS
jgi:hypothetical protein